MIYWKTPIYTGKDTYFSGLNFLMRRIVPAEMPPMTTNTAMTIAAICPEVK
jgi:hypothetical protein